MDLDNRSLAIGVLVILAVIIIAIMYRAEQESKKSKMTTVYGLSFIDLPHAPMRKADLELAATGRPPHFQPSDVSGESFAHLLS